MVTENEIRNQLEISKSLLGDDNHPMSETEWAFSSGYVRALAYALGQAKAKYDKEDL